MSNRKSRSSALGEAIDSLLQEHKITGTFDPDWLTDQLLIRGIKPSLANMKVALRKQVVKALQNQHFAYKDVYKVRQKLRVKRMIGGKMESLWCDSATANPQFWEESLKQNWESLADHAFRVYSTLKYYNEEKNPGQPFQLQFDLRDENADREQRPPGTDIPDPDDDDGED